MAIYVPPSTRRRRLVLLVAVGLVVGLAVGLLVGRGTAPGVDDEVDDVRAHAEDAATALRRLPIEYEQALTGSGGESTETITDAIDSARAQLDAAWAEADWFGPAVREPVDARLEALEGAVADRASPEEFEAAVGQAVEAVEGTFGVAVGEGP